MQHDFILLDRSASMASRWSEAIGSINAYAAKLATDKVDTGVTVATFDQFGDGIAFEVIRDRITPLTFAPITDADAMPRGNTPLNDAIGRIVTLANAGASGVQYDKVALVIVTDGAEIAFSELTHIAAKALLAACRAKGWQVIFIGADFDNAQQAQSFGNAANSTVSSSARNMGDTMHTTAAKRGVYGVTGQSIEYSDEEKARFAAK